MRPSNIGRRNVIALKSPIKRTQSSFHERRRLCVGGASNHVENETLAITFLRQGGQDLMQYPGIAYCRDIATEKFRARQPHVEFRSFQQIQLRVVQAICVPCVGVGSQ